MEALPANFTIYDDLAHCALSLVNSKQFMTPFPADYRRKNTHSINKHIDAIEKTWGMNSVGLLNRFLSHNCRRFYAKKVPNNLKGKSKSSQEWLARQLVDPYVEKARMMNYRCRSAFKLMEIDERFKILNPGDTVIDCGAAPGSWTQIAVEKTNATGNRHQQRRGMVISMDLLHFHAVAGATIFGGMDFTATASQLRIKETLSGRPVNCVLSDMAPNATGVRMLDQESITNLCYAVLRFAVAFSAPGANLVVKIWDNGDVPKLEKDMLRFYEKVKRIKPHSSRADSSEHFLVARNYKRMQETNDSR